MATLSLRKRTAAHAVPRSGRTHVTRGVIGAYVMVVLYALTLVLPLYWLLISAFKPRLQILNEPFVPTFSSGFAHFVKVWKILDMGTALLNSLYITAASLAVTLIISIPASYGLARSRGRTATLMERIYALGFLIPGFAALVPTLLLAIHMGLFYQREFMILYLPASAQPLTVILLTQFMRTVPSSLEESAMIDGAGRLRILWSVYLPLTVPGIASVTILNFISFWNEYLYTLVIVGVDPALRTSQVALPTLQGNQGITDYALVCAGTVLSVLPVFVVYAILNRRMENALVQGALKG
ncbi:MAG: carbohydrate ABC transporter permease [Actinoallomurus sp.]